MALDVLQAPVGGYIAVESDAGAVVVEANFADVLQLSSVEEVTEEEVRQWALRFSRVHLVIIGGGPPCQGVSGLNFGRKGADSHIKRIIDLVQLGQGVLLDGKCVLNELGGSSSLLYFHRGSSVFGRCQALLTREAASVLVVQLGHPK